MPSGYVRPDLVSMRSTGRDLRKNATVDVIFHGTNLRPESQTGLQRESHRLNECLKFVKLPANRIATSRGPLAVEG